MMGFSLLGSSLLLPPFLSPLSVSSLFFKKEMKNKSKIEKKDFTLIKSFYIFHMVVVVGIVGIVVGVDNKFLVLVLLCCKNWCCWC